ncbi:MAG: class I SAM-dependent methyltransferase [Pseudomonadota bacterium]
MVDRKTIEAYDLRVGEYAALVAQQNEKSDPALLRFIEKLKKGYHVLDLGCGPGHAAHTMKNHGLVVDAVDASPEMVKLANETYGVGARVMLFAELEAVAHYDGVWANFSLLHAPISEFSDHLAAIRTSLKTGGWFHIAMKSGEGEKRDSLNRLYAYYTHDDLADRLEVAGFEIKEEASGELRGLTGDLETWIAIDSVAV